MKRNNLVSQTVLFSVSCFFLLWFVAWMIRFPISRELFAILVTVMCLGAEIFVGYLALRQLWKWSGRATRQIRKTQVVVAVPMVLEQHVADRAGARHEDEQRLFL